MQLTARGSGGARRYIAAVVLLLAELPLLYPQPFVDSDALLHWFVGHLVVTGGSPYDSAAWAAAGALYGGTIAFWGSAAPGLAWPYPPWTAWLLAPVGLFPPVIGSWIAVASFFAAGIAAVLIAIRSVALSSSGRAFALILGLGFQPFLYAVSAGQFSPLLALGSALLLLTPGHPRVAPFAFTLLLAKPQLTGVLVLAAATELYRRDRRLVLSSAVAFLVLAAVSLVRFPDVLGLTGSGLGARVVNQSRVSASSWSLASAVAGEWWVGLGALVVLATVGCWVCAVRWSVVADRRAVLLAGAGIVSLAAAPVARSYDQVLLLPALAVLVLLGDGLPERGRLLQRLALVCTAVVAPWLVFVSAQLENAPARIAVVPLLFSVALFGSALARRRSTAPGVPFTEF